jgi:hypothetical protein
MSWFGTRGIVLTKGYGFRNNSGNFAIFAAIRRASSLLMARKRSQASGAGVHNPQVRRQVHLAQP